MSSYFNLELDTTPPKIEIISPIYTSQNNNEEIQIISNEKLSSFQEIYFIDGLGNKFDFTFNQIEDNILIGNVFFNCSDGIGNLYVRVKDEMDNLSDLYIKPIHIYSVNGVFMDIKMSSKNITIKNDIDKVVIRDKFENIIVKNSINKIIIKDNLYNMKIK